MRTVEFDGHVLNDIVYVEDVRRPLWSGLRVQTADVPGMDGTLFTGATAGSTSVSVDVRCIKGSKEDMRSCLATLASWLCVREPKVLRQSDRPGLYDLAIPTGTPGVDEFLGTGGSTIEFLVPSPASFGASCSAAATPGQDSRLLVGGTYPTAPSVGSAAAVRDGKTGLWGVRVDGGDYVRVRLPDGGAHAVRIDCAARAATVDGSNAIPTIDSDWISLDPGEHRASVELGSGAASIGWEERWL